MKYGVALPESVHDQHLLGDAVDRFTQRAAKPDFVPIWCRDRIWPASVIAELQQRDVKPMIYMTSQGWTYQDILAGDHDGELTAFAIDAAQYGKRIVVRWDQEPNSDFGQPWADEPPARYIATFRHVSVLIRAIAPDVRMFYCPSWRGRHHLGDFERYYPGDAAQVVGFDAYVRDPNPRPLRRRWKRPLRLLRGIAPGTPIIIGEFGMLRGLKRRRRWLRSLGRVRGVETAVYFDIDLPHRGVRWSMGKGMRRAWKRLPR